MLREFNNLHKIADGVCAKLSLETLREIVYNETNQKSAKRRKKTGGCVFMKKTLVDLFEESVRSIVDYKEGFDIYTLMEVLRMKEPI